jgi:hypothetical protein
MASPVRTGSKRCERLATLVVKRNIIDGNYEPDYCCMTICKLDRRMMRTLGRQCIALFVLAGLLASARVRARQWTQFITAGVGSVTAFTKVLVARFVVSLIRTDAGTACAVQWRRQPPLHTKTVIRDGLTAPRREGAIRYCKERGWL